MENDKPDGPQRLLAAGDAESAGEEKCPGVFCEDLTLNAVVNG